MNQNEENKNQHIVLTCGDILNQLLDSGWYHIRLKNFNPDETEDAIQNKVRELISKFPRYICAKEGGQSVGLHFHIVALIPVGLVGCTKDRKILKRHIKSFFPTFSGNRNFSISVSRSLEQLKKYVVKDGEFEFKGFTDDEIEIISMMSHRKYDKKAYNTDMNNIEKEFYDKKTSTVQFGQLFYDIRESYGLKTSKRQLQEYVRYHKFKVYPEEKVAWIEMALMDL